MPKLQATGYAPLDGDEGEGGQRGDEIAELQRLVQTLEQEVASPQPEPEAAAGLLEQRAEETSAAETSMAEQVAELQKQMAALTPRSPAEALGRDSVSKEEHKAALAENKRLRQVVSSVKAVADDEERLRKMLSTVDDDDLQRDDDFQDDGKLRAGAPTACPCRANSNPL